MRRFPPSILLKLTRVLLASVVILTIAGLFGVYGKYFELASHFRVQYLLAAVACLPVFAFFRSRVWTVCAAVYVLIVALLLLPWYIAPASDGSAAWSQPFKLFLFNVNYGNTRFAEAVRLVEAENPDVLILQEVNAAWLTGVEKLGQTYPHSVSQPYEGDGSGIALFSRLPLEEARIVYVGSEDRPGVHARFKVGDASVSLLSIHPRAPLRPGHFEARNRQLLASAEFVRSLPEPKIFVGDLNSTPWSPYFQRLEAEAGVTDARRGFGLLPTWPVGNRVAPLMLPVDHCLVSRDIQVLAVETGPAMGSDHLPLIVQLAVRAPSR